MIGALDIGGFSSEFRWFGVCGGGWKTWGHWNSCGWVVVLLILLLTWSEFFASAEGVGAACWISRQALVGIVLTSGSHNFIPFLIGLNNSEGDNADENAPLSTTAVQRSFRSIEKITVQILEVGN